MASVLAKARKTQKKPPVTRMCLKCHCVKPLTHFYSNRDWVEQAGKDCWCKDCVSKCVSKDEMREYFFENHRKWDERIWTGARKKAEMQAAKNVVYQKSNEERRETILDALTCQMVPTVMQIHYAYIDNSQDINVQNYEEAKEAGKIIEMDASKAEVSKKTNPNIKVYNAFFNGDFKASELEYLENYYRDLEKDFDLSDVALRDNAKKLAKAALAADRLQNDYMAGRCSMQDVNLAVQLYNSLLSIGNFAASKRKPEEKKEMGSYGELTLYLETHGYPMTRMIVWDKDDVDKTIDEYRYIFESIGLDE